MDQDRSVVVQKAMDAACTTKPADMVTCGFCVTEEASSHSPPFHSALWKRKRAVCLLTRVCARIHWPPQQSYLYVMVEYVYMVHMAVAV